VESCVWQTMDGSSGSDFVHVWSIHRSCVIGQHGRQVCRQPIIAGSEMVTICSSGCFKQIRKNQNFYDAAFVAFYWQTGWDVSDFSHVHEVCSLGIKHTLVMRFTLMCFVSTYILYRRFCVYYINVMILEFSKLNIHREVWREVFALFCVA